MSHEEHKYIASKHW